MRLNITTIQTYTCKCWDTPLTCRGIHRILKHLPAWFNHTIFCGPQLSTIKSPYQITSQQINPPTWKEQDSYTKWQHCQTKRITKWYCRWWALRTTTINTSAMIHHPSFLDSMSTLVEHHSPQTFCRRASGHWLIEKTDCSGARSFQGSQKSPRNVENERRRNTKYSKIRPDYICATCENAQCNEEYVLRDPDY